MSDITRRTLVYHEAIRRLVVEYDDDGCVRVHFKSESARNTYGMTPIVDANRRISDITNDDFYSPGGKLLAITAYLVGQITNEEILVEESHVEEPSPDMNLALAAQALAVAARAMTDLVEEIARSRRVREKD